MECVSEFYTSCFVCRRTSFLKKGTQRYERCPSVVPSEGFLEFLCLSLPFAAILRLHNHCSVERVYKSILFKDGFFRKNVVELQKYFSLPKPIQLKSSALKSLYCRTTELFFCLIYSKNVLQLTKVWLH